MEFNDGPRDSVGLLAIVCTHPRKQNKAWCKNCENERRRIVSWLWLPKRFWEKVKRSTGTACWEWMGATDSKGYGQFKLPERASPVNASRVAYWLSTGVWPGESQVCHKCDNPPCENPSHLFLGTRSDNMQDMVAKGRGAQSQKTHCPQGHPYSKENTYFHASCGRICRICRRAAQRRYKAKQRP